MIGECHKLLAPENGRFVCWEGDVDLLVVIGINMDVQSGSCDVHDISEVLIVESGRRRVQTRPFPAAASRDAEDEVMFRSNFETR